MGGPRITFDGVNLQLSGNDILRDVNLSIEPGTIHCLIGPNGGGKTSLIRCLLGQMPHTGTISVDWDKDKTIGYVPQLLDFDKTLPISVTDFMSMICQQYRPAFTGFGKRHRARATAALDRVGLAGKRKARLGSLSGGERQRVLFAQALIPEPSLLVLDEPMTSMDEVGEDIFVTVIKELAAEGVTIVWIAHDLAKVRVTADRVSCVNRKILFSGPPAEVLADRHADVLFGQIGSLA
jgi:zinc transport system ATP-binding protein